MIRTEYICPVAQDPRDEVFTTAGAYHAAVARYCHALRNGGDLETAAQELLGRGLFYRSALEKLVANGDAGIGGGRRLRCLKVVLDGASRQYMAVKRRGPGTQR